MGILWINPIGRFIEDYINQLAYAMGEKPEGSITVSLFGQEMTSNISIFKEENKQIKVLINEKGDR